ncbi:ankyrin repeat-containing protein ITN1-like [Camellia sinensis]|uniref:ankyrin repeat-containing protein ITN1-like n=1 Tax=Camellia sinensis TaxID=4442 RepID=UPI00103678CF|nr:ankyrin repeat-containing protein ITN1-like [Camellia sinensis]
MAFTPKKKLYMATIPIFDGINYKFWSVKMRTLLLSMDLWDTVENGYDETNREERKKDAAALSHIQQGVSDSIFPEIEDATTAKQAWDDLLEQANLPDYMRNVISVTPTDLRQIGANHLIVATLVATVAFTAGFTMPGGYNGNDGPNQGMAILTREAAFKAFMVTDTIAMSLSISAVLIHFYAAVANNRDMLENQVYTAAYLIIYATVAMVLAFVTGTYAVLAHSSSLAISVCVIGCLPLFFFLITRIIKNCTDLCANNLMGSCIPVRPRRSGKFDIFLIWRL